MSNNSITGASAARVSRSTLVEANKMWSWRHLDAVTEQIALENRHFSAMLREPAAKEAFAAFYEHRKPDYSKIFD